MKHSFRVSDSEISDGASLLETVESITGKIQVCYKRFPLRVIPSLGKGYEFDMEHAF